MKGKVNIRIPDHQAGANRWKALEEGRVKITGILHYDIGLILRDHLGQFCQAKVVRVGGDGTTFEAEVKGVLEEVRWAVELGLSNVDFESNSLLTVNIREENLHYLEMGWLLHDCRNLLSSRPGIVFSHTNKVAHFLANTLRGE